MTEALLIYGYLVLGSVVLTIKFFLLVVAFILGAWGSTTVMDFSLEFKEDFLDHLKPWMLWVTLPLFLLILVFPSKEDIAFIIGGSALWNGTSEIYNSEIPEKVIPFLEKLLEAEK